MSWYQTCFDFYWVRCANCKCHCLFLRTAVERRRKCPMCKMNNRHELPKQQIMNSAKLAGVRWK